MNYVVAILFTCRHREILFWARVNLPRWQVCVPVDFHDASCVFSNLSSARSSSRNWAASICKVYLQCESVCVSPNEPEQAKKKSSW